MEYEVKIISYDPGKSEDVDTPPIINQKIHLIDKYQSEKDKNVELKNVKCEDGFTWQISINFNSDR